ncbi:hypothetical protein PTTG_02035 [Puccinia triticina 1-1 BBBD Race 1]|uniref:Uncharacterized protein n=2 Tax=Puccinia triticina TaxID=208348 RepID=A0A0C4EMP5_PUCT1|nr:uncharacterized protein PtA15_17A36 [Puccinia triticina]OAV93137.1 hypothetical protein PTTG_02035 [Puccinia triticina 1-1 BBBD Race 1]WAQ92555.1 hypothetical protein PtA15_17A36 [Puccinia triticina]
MQFTSSTTKLSLLGALVSVSAVLAAPAGGAIEYYPDGAPTGSPYGRTYHDGPIYNAAPAAASQGDLLGGLLRNGLTGGSDGLLGGSNGLIGGSNGLIGGSNGLIGGSNGLTNNGLLGLGLGDQPGSPLAANLRLLDGGYGTAASGETLGTHLGGGLDGPLGQLL